MNQAIGIGAGLVQFAHVAQDADGSDDFAIGIAQRRRVQAGGDHLARGAAGVETGIAGSPALNDLAQGCGKLARFFRADEARERLLQHLVGAKAQQFVDGIVGREDFAFQVRDKDRVGCVLDDDIRIERAVRPGPVSSDGGGGRRG